MEVKIKRLNEKVTLSMVTTEVGTVHLYRGETKIATSTMSTIGTLTKLIVELCMQMIDSKGKISITIEKDGEQGKELDNDR